MTCLMTPSTLRDRKAQHDRVGAHLCPGTDQGPTSFSGAPSAERGAGWLETGPCLRGASTLESFQSTPAICAAFVAELRFCFNVGQFPSLAWKEQRT